MKGDTEVLIKIAKKEYAQAWNNYENAIDYQDFNAQEIFASEIHQLRLKIKCLNAIVNNSMFYEGGA